ESRAEDSSTEGKHDAFKKHLAEELPSCCSEGDAHSHFTLTAGGICEKQIYDVRAGNAEHQHDDDGETGKKEQDCGPVARRKRAGLIKIKAVSLVSIRVGFGIALRESLEFSAGLRL